MSLRTCSDCSTQYALDLSACPHCGRAESAKRFPLFVTLSCAECGRGPWTVRLGSVTPGLIDLPTLACASCGSRVPVTWPPEEEPMSPKITTHGGATNARDAEPSPAVDASLPPAVAEHSRGHSTATEAVAGKTETEPEAAAEVQAEGAEVQADTDPYAGKTLAELRELATARDIPSYGSKAQLADRLREADAAASE